MFLASQYQASGVATGTKTGTPSDKSTKADSTKANDRDGGSLTDQDVYALYAQYEYFRHRFAQRNGAVTCAFQPYLVPGFPLAVFDDFQSRMHLIGYLMNVTQQFSSRSVQTSLNFGYGRTLYEFLDLLANEIDGGGAVEDRKNLAMAAAPAEPVKEIRDVIQHFHKAEQFYQSLLHQRKTTAAVFEYRKLIAFVDGKGELEDIMIEGINEETLAVKKKENTDAQSVLDTLIKDSAKQQLYLSGKMSATEYNKINAALNLAEGTSRGDWSSIVGTIQLETSLDKLKTQATLLNKPKVQHNLDKALTNDIAPKPGAEEFFDSYDAAMQYCARPICTLEEYIDFIRGVREGINDEVAYDDGSQVPSARYYTRIRKLLGATANFKPTDEQRGLGTKTPVAINPKTDTNFPELRAEWEKPLLAYRRNVYTVTEVQR
jgi:hypothetical protein